MQEAVTQAKGLAVKVAAVVISVWTLIFRSGVSPIKSNLSASFNLSRNWSGYGAANGTYTSVTGRWSVPKVSDTNTIGVDASWIGIGGITSHDLIQAGTQAIVDGSGSVVYNAFYEKLPDHTRPIPMAIHGGDSISATINQTAPQQWQITLTNNSTGENFHTTTAYTSSLSSAEWIEESPSNGRRVLPLDNFGSIQFAEATAVKNGQPVTLAEAQAKPITMADGLVAAAVPSSIGNDGRSFSVQRTNTIATLPQPGSNGPGSGMFRGKRVVIRFFF